MKSDTRNKNSLDMRNQVVDDAPSYKSTIESKLSNNCHFPKGPSDDEFASANEEKSHYPIQEEISHAKHPSNFVRNDNAGREMVRDHLAANHKSTIKRRSFFGYGIAGAIGFVISGSLFHKASKMISSKKEEKKISVSIHQHAIARKNSGLNSNG